MGLELRPLGVLIVHAFPDGSFSFDDGPKGTRSVSSFREILWEGEGINARSKWANGTYVSNSGVTEVEVRAMFETDDDALIYMQYIARVDLDKAMQGAGQISALSAGQCETSDDRYAWLNFTQLVGGGWLDFDPPKLTYEIYSLVPVDRVGQ